MSAGQLEPAEIGARVRTIRRRRGLSQDAAAGLAGISKPYLSMLESGQRRFERRGLIEDLARALSCSIADITGQPYLPADRDSADTLSAVSGIRLALHDHGPDDVPYVRARSVAELAAWADAVNEYCAQASYAAAGRDLDVLLVEAQAQAWTAPQTERAAAIRAAITACFAAGVVASRTGHVDLAAMAARRGYELSGRDSADPGLAGFARWYWAIELTSIGARERAQGVLTQGVNELSPVAHTAGKDTVAAEMLGHMHLQHARASARQQRADDAYVHLNEAEQLASRVGERNGMRQHFGPTNVAAWRVSTGIELRDGERAYRRAMRARVDISSLGSRERAASFEFDCARALMQGTESDDLAIRHLDTADRLAPQRVRPDPIARELVSALGDRARRRSWELDSLRHRFGLS